jgi:hypothetical protein
MMKDEGHSLIEWVAYHTHIGFDNICVYTNDCSDSTDDMLIRLEELGWVKHFRNEVPEGKKPQPNALTLATDNSEVMDSKWILVMDADEFLSIKCGRGRIDNLVEAVDDDADAIAVTWRFFGSNGITEWNPGLAIESYTRAAPDEFKKGWGVKTMFRPYQDIKLGIHRPSIKKAKQEPANAKRLFDQKWLNGSGDMMPDEFSLSGWRSTKPTLGYNLAELNHYGVKSYEGYLLRRVRGNVNNKADKYDAAYFALFDRNETEVTNALRHARGTRKKMAKILGDPIMRDLQDKAVAFHEARVQTLRASGEYADWVAQLKEASKISIDELDEVLFVQHLPKEWQAKVKEMQAEGVPDKTIAKMISQTQTAKKGETRAALLEAAGEKAPELTDSAREKKESKEPNLADNPFLGTKEAKELGVPQAKIAAIKPKAPAAKRAAPKKATTRKVAPKKAAPKAATKPKTKAAAKPKTAAKPRTAAKKSTAKTPVSKEA